MYRRRQCIHLPLVIDQLHDIIVKPMLTKDRFSLDYNSRYLDYPLLDFSLKRFAFRFYLDYDSRYLDYPLAYLSVTFKVQQHFSVRYLLF